MKVHISGVCGTATASLAGLLRAKGHRVTGSDQDVYPPMSDELERMGVPVCSPYSATNIPDDAEMVVIGNALSRGNPEVEAVLDAKRRYTSQAALLAEEFLRDRTSIVVAGTHGKTTTTSMLTHVLRHAGLDPSFLIGGVSLDLGTSYGLGSGPHFVVEGDEYDTAFFDKRPKFVHYLPDIAIIGNVEFDHADIYADLAAVQLAFTRLMGVIPRRGLLIAGIESPGLALILGGAKSRVATFAIGDALGAVFQARAVTLSAEGARFEVFRDGGLLGRIQHEGVWEPQRPQRPRRHRRGPRSRSLLRPDRRCLRRLPRGQATPRDARGGEGHPGLRRLRPSSDRGSRDGRRPALPDRPRPTAWWRSSSRGPTPRAPECSNRTSRRAFATADEVVISRAHLPGKVPEAQRISEEMLVDLHQSGGWPGPVHRRGRRDRDRNGGRDCAPETTS